MRAPLFARQASTSALGRAAIALGASEEIRPGSARTRAGRVSREMPEANDEALQNYLAALEERTRALMSHPDRFSSPAVPPHYDKNSFGNRGGSNGTAYVSDGDGGADEKNLGEIFSEPIMQASAV